MQSMTLLKKRGHCCCRIYREQITLDDAVFVLSPSSNGGPVSQTSAGPLDSQHVQPFSQCFWIARWGARRIVSAVLPETNKRGIPCQHLIFVGVPSGTLLPRLAGKRKPENYVN